MEEESRVMRQWFEEGVAIGMARVRARAEILQMRATIEMLVANKFGIERLAEIRDWLALADWWELFC